jgi:hypothetical protein
LGILQEAVWGLFPDKIPAELSSPPSPNYWSGMAIRPSDNFKDSE